jgi:hypothetical protein
LLLFSDSLPLSKLIIPNPHGRFRLEKQSIIFEGYNLLINARSVILKEGISNGILKMFVC